MRPSAINTLAISCHMSDKCGDTLKGNGASLVPFPTVFGFHDKAALDPGSFRVEVVDENNTAMPSVFVHLEALCPDYQNPMGWSPFQGSERVRRGLVSVECEKVNGLAHTFRSRYLRLVTDEKDQQALAANKQGLLVTDSADGKGGPADRVEILDQKVRITYDPTPATPAAATDKKFPKPSVNALTSEAEVGVDGLAKKRIRLFLHFVGFDQNALPEVERHARRRAMKWVRRVFASANMAPKIIGTDALAAPAGNMLTIQSMIDPAKTMQVVPPTKGQNALLAATTLTLTLQADGDPAPTVVNVPLGPGLSPTGIGAAILGAMPQGIAAEVFPVPPSTERFGFEPSCDVLFTKAGKPAVIISAVSDDQDLPASALLIPKIAPDFKDIDNDDMFHGGSPLHRSILRLRADWNVNQDAARDDRIDVFVVPSFPLEGRAYPTYLDINLIEAAKYIKAAMPAGLTPEQEDELFITNVPLNQPQIDQHLPKGSLRRAVILSRESQGKMVTDGGDTSPFTFAHELVHVLADSGHTNTIGCILNPWFKENQVDAFKRIYTAPLLLASPCLVSNILPDDKQKTRVNQDMRSDVRDRGGAFLTEPW